MTTLLTALVGVVLAAGTAIGVVSSVSDDSNRAPAGHSTSDVQPYGTRK